MSFLHTLFLENEAQIDKNNYGTMLFMSKQVSLAKIRLILQKMKISPKNQYTVAPHYNEVPWYRKNVRYSGVFVRAKTPL